MDKGKVVKQEKSSRKPVRIGISIGDINGIGPEVIMKALNDPRIFMDCMPIVYGSTKVFSYHKKNIRGEFSFQVIDKAEDAKRKKINVINIWEGELEFKLGEPTEKSGQYALDSLENATKDLAAGKIDVLVTAPISKDAMNKNGFKFPGHTEYLADMSGQEEALMLMVSPSMRVGLVTCHIPLKEVTNVLSIDKISAKINEFNASLKKDFGIKRPKIAVLGVNPHAGENGKMGEEESTIIKPAIDKVLNENVLAFGPFPADGFFGSANRANYDGVLAMYHDQGLSAFKALSFDEGVNFTAGLPIIRTSPDHGTAYDIAGKNKASGDSMRNAIYLAIDVFRVHQQEKEYNANPLAISEKKENRRENRR